MRVTSPRGHRKHEDRSSWYVVMDGEGEEHCPSSPRWVNRKTKEVVYSKVCAGARRLWTLLNVLEVPIVSAARIISLTTLLNSIIHHPPSTMDHGPAFGAAELSRATRASRTAIRKRAFLPRDGGEDTRHHFCYAA